MFALDPKFQESLQPHIGRVLIVEDNPNYARMLTDMFRMLGSANIVVERTQALAMQRAQELNPQIIVVEYRTDHFDGIAFTQDLRRSALSARKAPVILIKGDITATHLKQARNAGVHEVLKRPFAWQDLLTRLRNVVFKPRDWIDSVAYAGPDRRRFNTGGDYTGARKRKGEANSTALLAVEEAVTRMNAVIDRNELSHNDLTNALLQQMAVIVPKARYVASPDFVRTVSQMVAQMRSGEAQPKTLKPLVTDMMQQLNIPLTASPEVFILDNGNKTFVA